MHRFPLSIKKIFVSLIRQNKVEISYKKEFSQRIIKGGPSNIRNTHGILWSCIAGKMIYIEGEKN